MLRFLCILGIVFGLAATQSCREDIFNNDAAAVLSFSADTVTFDTIFTTIGSTTKRLKVYNPYKQSLKISQIYLAGADNSYFRLNIDGDRSDRLYDIELPPKDSLYIFIEVTIDPLGVNNPLVINDSIVFITNGNVQDVNLIAYGQDVHLINGEWINSTTWIADKPYLIYNSMGVDSSETLTIEQGTTLYFHDQSLMIILGKLIVNGTLNNPVVFRGDRLDYIFPDLPYDKMPGLWGGLFFYPTSTGNKLSNCRIRNAVIGVFLPGAANKDIQSELEMENCIVENNSFAGIYAFNSRILALNCLIVNNGVYTFAGLTGGDYRLYNCTLSNHYIHSGGQPEPVVTLTNYIYNNDTLLLHDLTRAEFINCIIEGNHSNELFLRSKPERSFAYSFDHCLIDADMDSIDSGNATLFHEVIFNKDPHFKQIPNLTYKIKERYMFDFSLDTLSFAKDKGTDSIFTYYPQLEFDIVGNSRLLDAAPDIGAYERIE